MTQGFDVAVPRSKATLPEVMREQSAGTPDDVMATLQSEASAALSKVETLFEVRLAAPVDIVFGTDPAKIAERAEPLIASSAGAVGRVASGVCKDAPGRGVSMTHLPGVILICQRPGVVYHGGFDPREVRGRLGHMLAMELIAQLSGDRANGPEEDYLNRTAEKLRKDGVTNPRKMEYYSSSLADAEGIGRTGLLVADDLTSETGLALIGVFYRTLGTGVSVEESAGLRQIAGRGLRRLPIAARLR